MTNEELLERIAINKIVAKDKADIREEVRGALELVQQSIHQRIKGYWLKENDSFTLGTDDHTVNLISHFPSLLEVRFFWTTDGPITIKPEKWFRNRYPDPSEKDTPIYAMWLTGQSFRFYPSPSSDTTIYISYFFKPNYNDITVFPEQFHYIIAWGVLSHFEDNPSKENSFTRGKYTRLFEDALKGMSDNAGPLSDHQPELIYNKGQGDINEVSSGLDRM